MTIVGVRCFIDGKCKKTHLLTKQEAKYLRASARLLIRYLTKEYKLGR